MKITDLHESKFLSDKNEIIKWMHKSFVQFYTDNLTIESDGLIYDGNLALNSEIRIPKLKVQFKEVSGIFNFSYTSITSLKGSPQLVGVNFYCHNTFIENLEGCPKIVKGNFSCNNNRISSLKFCPQSIGGIFYCGMIKITDPKEYRFALYCEIGGEFDSNNKEIDNIINEYKGSSNKKYWPHAINLLSKVKL